MSVHDYDQFQFLSSLSPSYDSGSYDPCWPEGVDILDDLYQKDLEGFDFDEPVEVERHIDAENSQSRQDVQSSLSQADKMH